MAFTRSLPRSDGWFALGRYVLLAVPAEVAPPLRQRERLAFAAHRLAAGVAVKPTGTGLDDPPPAPVGYDGRCSAAPDSTWQWRERSGSRWIIVPQTPTLP
jgi:hypothetical protein